MTQKEREKILKSFSQPQLEGLKEIFDIKIAKLTDVENINSFEELLGKRLAIKVLKEIMYELKLLKEKPFKREKNEYL
jgi:hypothetical protein